MASWEVFSLSTIQQPLPRMAKVAARMLIDRLEYANGTPHRVVAFPTHLVKRDTTGPATGAA
jgi:LacI family transcriptional regulator, galactose operon repressor